MSGEQYLQDILEWDVVNWSPALTYWEQKTKHDLSSAYALELGSRHGGLSLWLALKGSKVICTDLNGPTDLAVQKHKKYGVSNLIEYEAVNAMKIPYREKFDLILFKSILGGIGWDGHPENQRRAINEIYYALKPGGELFFVENLVGSPLHRMARRYFVQWGRRWRYVTIQEIRNYLAPFSRFEYVCGGFLGAFGRNEMQRRILGRLDNLIINHIVPDGWKYIIAGVAQK
jgi:SAM-dependent methyltransferase